MLKDIEYKTKREITELEIPSNKQINELRLDKLKSKLSNIISLNSNNDTNAADKNHQKAYGLFSNMISELKDLHNISGDEIAAALTMLKHIETPILIQSTTKDEAKAKDSKNSRKSNKSKLRNKNKSIKKSFNNYPDQARSKSKNTARRKNKKHCSY